MEIRLEQNIGFFSKTYPYENRLYPLKEASGLDHHKNIERKTAIGIVNDGWEKLLRIVKSRWWRICVSQTIKRQ